MQNPSFDNKGAWWRQGVIYQVYPRSFLDTNADGIGDLRGIIQKLDYLNDGTEDSLGVDAIWLNPIFPSPMADFGYDVSDYCSIHPDFGDLKTFDEFVTLAHQHHIKVILDFVPNHTSDRHPWFLSSRSGRDNQKRNWYIWRDAKPDGSFPNNWGSAFGGPAWEWDDLTSQYYLHTFLKEQPDLNWRSPDVQKSMLEVLRFWLDRGVDGFRMDVVGLILKDPELRDNPEILSADNGRLSIDLYGRQNHLYDQDLDEVHPLLRSFRKLLDEFPERCGIGEVWYELPRWVKYYGEQGDELHLPFNFRLMKLPWNARDIRNSVDELENALPDFAWPNYVLNSHDEPRLVSRIGMAQARIAAMLLLTLRGTPTLYFGEEIGMKNGEISPEQMRDPQGIRLGLAHCRDFSRTPMQWTDKGYAGFSSTAPWLPIPSDYTKNNVETEARNAKSMLVLYRRLIHLRKNHPALHSGIYRPLNVNSTDCYVYERRDSRGEQMIIALNFSAKPLSVNIPGLCGGKILLSTTVDRVGTFQTDEMELKADEGLIVEMAKHPFLDQEE